jgi:ribosomal-protein-alanine N-acetyltransferase
MTANIIEASIIHARVISILHGACFEEGWNEKSISEVLNMAGTTGFIVGADAETPQGFILFRVAAGEAEIISIGVIPAARKNGLAKILLRASIEGAAMRDAAKMFLEVATNNTAARALYETAKFKIIGKRPGYYDRASEKLDAIIYSLNILDKKNPRPYESAAGGCHEDQ